LTLRWSIYPTTTGSCASKSSSGGSSGGADQNIDANQGRMSSDQEGEDTGSPPPPAAPAPQPPASAAAPSGSLLASGSLAAALESGLEDDADMSRLQNMLEARGFPPHLAGVLGPRMHNLIVNRGMAPSTMSKAQQLLTGLQATGDESRQLQAVIEISQLLVMGNEDTLAGFPIRQVVPALIALLKMEHNFDLMNNSCRALTYMMDALPRSSAVIVEAIPTFLEKLQVIQCMDVAEQSLTALEMLSKKHYKSILHAKGVPACLMYLDFFSISAQVKALTVTANSCQGLQSEEFVLVQEAIPIISSRLKNEDKKSVDLACQALSRLADSYKQDKERLAEIGKPEVLANLQELLQKPTVSASTFTTCLHILVVLTTNNPTTSLHLLQQNMGDTLKKLLVVPALLNETTPSSSKSINQSMEGDMLVLVPRSHQELYEMVSLIGELLPPLPGDGVFAVDALLAPPGTVLLDPVVWQWQDDRGSWHTYGYNDCRTIEAAFLAGETEVVLNSAARYLTLNLVNMHEIREDCGTAKPLKRVLTSQLTAASTTTATSTATTAAEEEEPAVEATEAVDIIQLTAQLTATLFPVLIEIYSASAGPGVKHAALQAMLRMVVHTEGELLTSVLNPTFVSSQCAAMLSSQDLKITVAALQLSKVLLEKLPSEFSVHFRREGVLHQIQKLTDPDYSLLGSDMSDYNLSWGGHSHHHSHHAGAGGTTPPPPAPGRSWTLPGSSFANIFPEHLRTRRSGGSSSSAAEPAADAAIDLGSSGDTRSSRDLTDSLLVATGSTRDSPEASPAASSAATGSATVQQSSSTPMRLSDMLKRKRNTSRKSSRKSSGGLTREELRNTPGLTPILLSAASAGTGGNTSGGAGTAAGGSGATPKSSSSTPAGRRSRLSSASSLFSSLNPVKWGRSTSHQETTPTSSITMPTHTQTREKVKTWVRNEAQKLLEENFKESLGSRHPALTILRRLSAQVDHLTKKPQNGERCLKEIQSILVENDISPFEVCQSGLVASLLTYLSRPDNATLTHPSHTTTPTSGQDHDVGRMTRVRTFLHVFVGAPKSVDAEVNLDPDLVVKFSLLIAKLNACVNHLEQFPIKMYDIGPPGLRSAGSTLKFFKTHHLKCSLQRHPECTSLKSWKGGLVKIDPLALVQAIERYLVTRGYGKPSDKDSGSDDDDMSDEGGSEDTLGNTNRERNNDQSQRLEFMIGENRLPRDMTVYQAVQQFGGPNTGQTDDSDSDTRGGASMLGSPGVWARIHTIYYRPATDSNSSQSGKQSGSQAAKVKADSSSKKGKGGKGQTKRKAPDELWTDGTVPERQNPLIHFLDDKLPREFLQQDPSSDVLSLLKILWALNRFWYTLYPGTRDRNIVTAPEFINSKLTAKMNRQLQDPIIIMTSNLPQWLKEIGMNCPFLFPFETRQLLFYVTSFDRDRALSRLLEAAPDLAVTDTQERVNPELDRKKRVISRETILKQGEQLMTELASSRSLIEIQYEGEVGTGLGPTLEFYSLVSKELQRSDLQLWKGATVKIGSEEAMDEDKSDDPCVEYVHSDTGLFPLPLARNTKSSHKTKIKNKFTFLGKFMAKAVLDNRMIDLPFSQPFFKWMLQEEHVLDTQDLSGIDPEISNTVNILQGIVRKKAKLENNDKLTALERHERISSLTMDGCPIEDLGLDFTLPGYPNIELRKGGKDMSVSLDNLSDYINLVSHWMLVEGVSTQMESLREGFNSVFPIVSLQMFFPDELDQIFCGSGSESGGFQSWDFNILMDSCKPDHGYTFESPAIINLFQILSEYNQDDQRAFLQFVTGCPRLPVGSFKALSPPLTIVKKTFDTPEVKPDDYLPSVMTCANYLKLPDYSSREIMKEKLHVAAAEGQYCFHLS
jgi:E3 ubiquitin-protein ligase TRIP12